MVYDSGKQPDGFNNDEYKWNHSEPEADPFAFLKEQPAFGLPLKPKAKIAQAATKFGPIPIGFPLPKVPWVTQEDLWKIFNFLKNGQNPLTGETIETPAEKKAFKNLTGEQIRGLNNTKYKEELKFATDSFTNERGCTCIQLGIGNGGPIQTMMTEALTGADQPTLIVDPNGHAALFDGLYRPGTSTNTTTDKRLTNQVFEIEALSPNNKAQEVKDQNHLRAKVPEWERQAIIANQCGYNMRVAIPDPDLVQYMNQGLKNVHPSFRIIEAHLGGTYGQVRANTVNGEVHHMPANEVNPLSTAKGSAIWMRKRDHRNTESSGSSDEAKDYRAKQKELIKQGKTKEAILEDVKDVDKIAPGLYDISIKQMLKKYKRNQDNAGKK